MKTCGGFQIWQKKKYDKNTCTLHEDLNKFILFAIEKGKQTHHLGSVTFSHVRMSRKVPSSFVVPVPSSACLRVSERRLLVKFSLNYTSVTFFF